VQALFLRHVCAETVVVGHGLENDLRALRVLHGRVLDTAIMYPNPRGPQFKPALKVLASRFLKRSIQARTAPPRTAPPPATRNPARHKCTPPAHPSGPGT